MSEHSDLHYFDYAATTPADPRVIESMFDCLGADGVFGNPASSSHAAGIAARDKVEHARQQVADLIGADVQEIVWTSGATESNNLTLKGYADMATARRHLVTSQIEHKAILDTMASLEKRGMTVTYLHPADGGEITAEAVAQAIGPQTGLVSLMLVNNEIGTLTDIATIAPIVHAAGALLHVDAAQALGKTPINVKALGIDLMSMSAHKLYGPKGIGALYVSREVAERIAPQMHGGGHELGLRSGTLATHQIVGMGVACELAAEKMASDNERIAGLSEYLLDAVLALGDITQNARLARRIPHTLSLTVNLPGFQTTMLGEKLAVSSTSACNSAAGKPSHVLTSIGLDANAAGRTVRLSFGRYTARENVDYAIECFRHAVETCRSKAVGTRISPEFAIAPQLTLDDLQAVRNQGFRTIICNRPDGEEPGQPTFSDIAEAAGRLGIEARYLPVVSGKIGEDDLASFAGYIESLPAPVLAYCSTGTRSGMLWNMSEPRRK
ncbi:aminotransferase class V-fold PLP-dependent enzyme [Paraburkholderia sp. BCC1885]|uniref:aminotransferase class V-fold PLP-dependent enzyme n=1 Tax=Paraburkholderia sp. BCC1885 TaxID=2562669 RepID=UPI001182CAAD|nr:aminotransferase class V-fold PLP-dependent enzyme [Paraburkholderia sp. BCC1885]